MNACSWEEGRAGSRVMACGAARLDATRRNDNADADAGSPADGCVLRHRNLVAARRQRRELERSRTSSSSDPPLAIAKSQPASQPASSIAVVIHFGSSPSLLAAAASSAYKCAIKACHNAATSARLHHSAHPSAYVEWSILVSCARDLKQPPAELRSCLSVTHPPVVSGQGSS